MDGRGNEEEERDQIHARVFGCLRADAAKEAVGERTMERRVRIYYLEVKDGKRSEEVII